MGMSRGEAYAALEAIYAKVPDVACRGLCGPYCGPVPMSALELGRMRRAGADPHGSTLQCGCLAGGRCAAYDLRPLICRLWGAVRNLRCPWGCAPPGRLLSDREARDLMQRVEDVAVAAGFTGIVLPRHGVPAHRATRPPVPPA